MVDMGSVSTAGSLSHVPEMPSWKNLGSHAAAAATAFLFIVAGVWKATHPFQFAQMAEELLVPSQLSIALTLTLAPTEILAGVLVLVPKFRKWGALLASLLLISFMIYMGARYSALLGKDCSCFPWLKRTVGPRFFAGDAAMLAVALLAGWWSKPALHIGRAAMVAALVVAFTGGSYGYALSRQTGAKAPESITVAGKPFSLAHGKYFIFFFDPECSHCNAAAKTMSKYTWKSDVQIVGVPTRVPQWAEAFMKDNGLKGVTTLDLNQLKTAFPFGDPPYGVFIENGRQQGSVPRYEEGNEPAESLRKLGLIE
jgi:uncharacterized membrane protein YphA (DoxX/SURF4 family)